MRINKNQQRALFSTVMSRRKQARPIRVNENENGYESASQTTLNETKSMLVDANFHAVRDDEKLLREVGEFYLFFVLFMDFERVRR